MCTTNVFKLTDHLRLRTNLLDVLIQLRKGKEYDYCMIDMSSASIKCVLSFGVCQKKCDWKYKKNKISVPHLEESPASCRICWDMAAAVWDTHLPNVPGKYGISQGYFLPLPKRPLFISNRRGNFNVSLLLQMFDNNNSSIMSLNDLFQSRVPAPFQILIGNSKNALFLSTRKIAPCLFSNPRILPWSMNRVLAKLVKINVIILKNCMPTASTFLF